MTSPSKPVYAIRQSIASVLVYEDHRLIGQFPTRAEAKAEVERRKANPRYNSRGLPRLDDGTPIIGNQNAGRRRYVLCPTLQMAFFTVDDASKATGVSKSHIRTLARHGGTTRSGFTFEYIDAT